MTDRDPVWQDAASDQAGGTVAGPATPPPGPPVVPSGPPVVPSGPPVEPPGPPVVPPGPPPPGSPVAPPGPLPPSRPAPPSQGWVARRVVAVVIGSLLAVVAVGLLAMGGAATWLDKPNATRPGT